MFKKTPKEENKSLEVKEEKTKEKLEKETKSKPKKEKTKKVKGQKHEKVDNNSKDLKDSKEKATKKVSLLGRIKDKNKKDVVQSTKQPKKQKVNIDAIIKKASQSDNADLVSFAQETSADLNEIEAEIAKIEKNKDYFRQRKQESTKFYKDKITGIDDSLQKYSKLNESISKKSNVRNINVTNNFSIKKIKRVIQAYGFEVSKTNLLLILLASVGIPMLLGIVSQLNIEYIIVLGISGLIFAPIIISIYYRQAYISRKFQMIIDYLTNIVTIFEGKPIISYALEEVLDLVDYQMKDAIRDALMYMSTNNDDLNSTRTALEMIEQEFPNSRIKAAHRLMITVEERNTVNYQSACRQMYEDISAWISRINTFQSDLNDRRVKIILLCAMTAGMNCIMIYLYNGTEYFAGFTSSAVYQVAVTLFLMALVVVALIVLSKLNGSWLLDDATEAQDISIKKSYNTWEMGKQKLTVQEIIIAVLFGGTGFFFLKFMNNYALGGVCCLAGLYIITKKMTSFQNAYKALNRHFELEFPAWMRDITLNIYTDTVLNAIDASRMTCSYPLYRQLNIFIKEAKDNPTSIVPYSNLLKDFNCKDVQSSIKVLYAIQTYGSSQVEGQIDALTRRTQAMLDKSENLKNDARLRSIELLGYLPMIIFIAVMVVEMLLLFSHMMNLINATMASGMGTI